MRRSGLMEPVGCGIGGDLFAIVWDPKTKKLYGYNGSGRSPKGRTLDDLKKKLGDRKAIPSHGSLLGHGARHGRRLVRTARPLRQAADGPGLAPAIQYAREGFPVSQLVAYYWERNFNGFDRQAKDIEEIDNAKATYLIDGKTPAQGQIFKNPDLARTYDLIAQGRPRRLLQRRRSPRPSTPISSASAAICATKTSPRTRATGSIPSA